MTALWLIVVLVGGGLLSWLAGLVSMKLSRWTALAALAGGLGWSLTLWSADPNADGMLTQLQWEWIPQFGVSFHLALDGLSLTLVVLTFVLGIMGVLASWTSIGRRVGFFHFNLLWILAGVVGVFSAMDLVLFYFFWELMLVPMYFLIGIWGHEERFRAAIKFFIFTQASGLLMLAAILGLAFAHQAGAGDLSFDYLELLDTEVGPRAQMLMFLGFFAAFAVKMPVVPLHTWLPDAHTEAPTAGSVVLAGLLLKTGAYGLMRFGVPLFPQAAQTFAPVGMALGVLGILYGAALAFAQTDAKRLVAYTSVSHLGFVVLAIFAWNELALQGALMQMICHGLSTGGLFMLVGAMEQRVGTRDLRQMGGLWAGAPRLGGVALVLILASLGLPGLGNFIGEFLALLGAWEESRVWTIIATLGLVVAAVYSLWLMQQSFHGPPATQRKVPDIGMREALAFAVLIGLLLWLGLQPSVVFDAAAESLESLLTVPAMIAGG